MTAILSAFGSNVNAEKSRELGRKVIDNTDWRVYIGIVSTKSVSHICKIPGGAEMTKTTQSEVEPEAILLGQRLIIEGQEIPVEQRRVPLREIKLDPENPRIQHAVKRATTNGALGPDELRKLIL